jgi:hypothetical protein
MSIREYTAAFTNRYGVYTMIFILFALAVGFLYAFNFTGMFGSVPQ